MTARREIASSSTTNTLTLVWSCFCRCSRRSKSTPKKSTANATVRKVEAKTGKTRITQEQLDFLRAVREAGGIGMVVWDKDEMGQVVQQVRNWLP